MVNRLSAIPDIFIERFLHLGIITDIVMMASRSSFLIFIAEGNFGLTDRFSFFFIYSFNHLVVIILKQKVHLSFQCSTHEKY